MKSESKFKAVIDRIEGKDAVILAGEDQEDSFLLDARYLPQGFKEGDMLTFKIRLESRRTKEAKEKVAEMIEKLKNKK